MKGILRVDDNYSYHRAMLRDAADNELLCCTLFMDLMVEVAEGAEHDSDGGAGAGVCTGVGHGVGAGSGGSLQEQSVAPRTPLVATRSVAATTPVSAATPGADGGEDLFGDGGNDEATGAQAAVGLSDGGDGGVEPEVTTKQRTRTALRSSGAGPSVRRFLCVKKQQAMATTTAATDGQSPSKPPLVRKGLLGMASTPTGKRARMHMKTSEVSFVPPRPVVT